MIVKGEFTQGFSNMGQQGRANYDVSADGQQFVAFRNPGATNGDTTSLSRINIIRNWIEELKERVPIP